jgi:hypothetical protein
MALNIHDLNTLSDSTDKCIICLDPLNNETTYLLPECGHVYHQNCIMHWFRNGSNKCPLCNNLGINDSNPAHAVSWWSHQHKYKSIRQFARKKTAPEKLKKEVNDLKKTEDKLKQLRQEKKNLKTTIGEFADLHKRWKKIKIKEWNLRSSIRKKKLAVASFNIIPLIIAKKINI